MNYTLFSGNWCQPCQAVKKLLKELEVEVEVVDIDEQPEMAQKHRVRGVPTLAKMEDGRVVKSLVGIQTKQKLEDFLEVV